MIPKAPSRSKILWFLLQSERGCVFQLTSPYRRLRESFILCAGFLSSFKGGSAEWQNHCQPWPHIRMNWRVWQQTQCQAPFGTTQANWRDSGDGFQAWGCCDGSSGDLNVQPRFRGTGIGRSRLSTQHLESDKPGQWQATFAAWGKRKKFDLCTHLSKHPPLVQTKWEKFIKSLQLEIKTVYKVCVVQSVLELWSTMAINALGTQGPAVLGTMSWLETTVPAAQ